MQSLFYITIVVIAIIILVSFAIFIILQLTQKKYNNFILRNSVSLKQLNEINKHYSFYPYVNLDQSHTYDNEKFYNSISCKDYLTYQFQFIKNTVFNQIKKVSINKQQYSKYAVEVKSIMQFGRFQSPIGNLRLKKLIKREQCIFEKYTYQKPITQFLLKVTLYCSKINGQVYNSKSEIFSVNDIFIINKRLNNKNGNFYNDRKIWDALCRVERGKVSNKLRFSIYKRDKYRCCICGISSRNAQLEIDHVIPIAKGGKSTFDNLQTLCHKCNVEKGDSL